MPNDFLPLSGAILVTNPRQKVNTMALALDNYGALALDNQGVFGALALDNPNDRRRINKLARLLVQGNFGPGVVLAGPPSNSPRRKYPTPGLTKQDRASVNAQAEEAVALWESEKNTPAKNRDPRLQNFEGKGVGAGKEMMAHLVSLPKKSNAERAVRSKQYSEAKSAVARAFGKLPGYGPSKRNVWGGVITSPYATRAVGSKAKRYYTHGKKNERYQKGGALGAYQVVNVAGIRKANRIHQSMFPQFDASGTGPEGQTLLGGGWRMSGGGQGTDGSGRSGKIIKAFKGDQADQAWLRDEPYLRPGWDAANWTKQAGGWGTSYKPSAGSKAWNAFRKAHAGQGKSMKDLGAMYKAQGGAVSNPGIFGALALDNPRLQGMPAAFMYAGTVAAGAAVGGYAIKLLNENEMVEDTIAKIPVISQWPYAVTGILGGLTTGYVASMVGGDAGKWLGLAAGGMIAAGAAIQLWEGGAEPALALEEDDFLLEEEEDLGGIALDNDGVFGALALDNDGVFGGLGALALDNDGVFGDGMSYEIGPLTQDEFSKSYGDASLADAYFSGADLDVEEGQALMEGAPEFQRRFGHPPKRIALHGGKRAGASHLAGRRGHRWGWLFKLLGKGRAQRLASMPPARRVSVIRKLRENAIQTFNESLARLEGAPEFRPEHVSGGVPQSATGPNGAQSSYGAMLFAGDDI